MLSRNPGLCQEELAKELGVTQPAVCLRIKKLKQKGVIDNVCGLRVKGSGLYISVARGKAELNRLKKNPYFIAGFETEKEVLAVFAGENEGTARSVPKALIKDARVKLVKDFDGHITLEFRETGKAAMRCDRCGFYGDCLGMPGTEWYKGNLWGRN